MTAPGYTSPGVLSAIQFLLGMERTMVDMLRKPGFFQALGEETLAFSLGFFERFYAVAGDKVDFFRIGDDFGSQRGLLFGRAQWRDLIRPSMAAMSGLAKSHGSHYYHHSCGSVRDLIPELIEVGVEVLDPLQGRTEGMDPAGHKADFGDRLCFSGGVDEQDLLPHGTAAEVAQGLRDLLKVMTPGGGFFLGPTHDFRADMPTENIVVMYRAARDYQA